MRGLFPEVELVEGELVLKGTSLFPEEGEKGTSWSEREQAEPEFSRISINLCAISVLIPLMPESWWALRDENLMTK